MTRYPYRPRFVPLWLRETIAILAFVAFFVLCNWAFPLILDGMSR